MQKSTKIMNRAANFHNICSINVNNSQPQQNRNNQFVPSLLLTNVMSLAPKMDEIRVFLSDRGFDICCITEIWQRPAIDDNVVNIKNYTIIRKDRIRSQHGGACMYIRNTGKFEVLRDFEDPDSAEVLWVKIFPQRLPRGYSCVVIGVLYHPPSADDNHLINYLMHSLSRVECSIPNAGVILAGDFNRADVSQLLTQFRLSQMVKFETRGERTLDMILTNLNTFYKDADRFPPFGLSDHHSVGIFPQQRIKENISTRKIAHIRNSKLSSKQALGPPQTRRLVVDNYFLSTTLCRRQPKNIVCGANCRQLNAKILSCRRLVVSLVKKGNCLVVDNKLLSTTLRLTAFCRLWVRII